MSYLVDTNVFSEKLKPRSDAKVVAWLAENESELFISTLTIAEIRRGIERLPQGKRRDQFQQWLTSLNSTMAGSILSFNRAAAHSWGQMQGQLDLKGIRISPFDGILAATAIRHGLTVVTRNERDFKDAPVRMLNPFR